MPEPITTAGNVSKATVRWINAWGFGSRSVTPRLWRLIGFLAGHLSFGVVEKALQESHELEISREVVRLVAEDSGKQALCWERAEEARYSQQENTAVGGSAPKTWIIECDGKKVGYQDGSWHEVKVGIIYELADRVGVSKGRQELLKREVVARPCAWEEFASLFWTAMHRTGVQAGDRLVAVADGVVALRVAVLNDRLNLLLPKPKQPQKLAA